MDDKPLDIDKNSASTTEETELLSPQKDEESANEAKQLSPKNSDLPHEVEFSKSDDYNEKAPEQGSTKSIHLHQANKETQTSESEKEISKSPRTLKTKAREEPTEVVEAKRRKSHHSTSDRNIEDKPRIRADPDCTGATTVESISPRPSTSAGANRSYDSLEPQDNDSSNSQGLLSSAQANDMDDQPPNPKRRIMTITQAYLGSFEKLDAATETDETNPSYSSERSKQIEKGESIPKPESISDGINKHYALKSIASERCRMVSSSNDDEEKTGTGQIVIRLPDSFTTSISVKIKNAKVTFPSCDSETASGSSNSDSSNMFQKGRKLALYHCKKDKDPVPTTSVRMFQGDQEITIHSSCEENTRRDDTITGPPYSCSNESARDSTFSQSSARMSLDGKEVTGSSKVEENAPVVTSFSFSPSMYEPEDITSPFNYEDEKESSTFPSASNETTESSKGEENAIVVTSFSFSPSMYEPEDITSSYNYEVEKESSTLPSASVRIPQGDQETTVHSSCDENVRREEIACGHSTIAEESGNIGSTSAQESSHKFLDKA